MLQLDTFQDVAHCNTAAANAVVRAAGVRRFLGVQKMLRLKLEVRWLKRKASALIRLAFRLL